MIISPPATGHVNPMCGIVSELSKQQPDLKILFYNDECYRELIEKAGAEFRAYSHPTVTRLPLTPLLDKKNPMADAFNIQIDFTRDLLPQLIEQVEREQPNLILYDAVFAPAKFLIKILQARYEKRKSTFPLPKNAMFVPNFPPNERMMRDARENTKMDIKTLLGVMGALFRQFGLSWSNGISAYNPMKMMTEVNPNLNIVAVTPELQPHPEDFDMSIFKFVGPCISEEARSIEITNDDRLKSVLDGFPIRDLKNYQPNSDSSKKLIYLSLGTLLNINVFVFETAIEAVRVYDQKPNRAFKSSQLRVIMSVGQDNLKSFEEKIARGELNLPENVLLRARVPQLEVLKRAHVFVTHCGMNSASETIQYAVPAVCIPLGADQPTVAKRLEELAIGVRLDPYNLSAENIADAVDRVLSDEKFARNAHEMSQTMAKYNGKVDGAKYILDYLNK